MTIKKPSKIKLNKIRKELVDQLNNQGKDDSFFADLIDDYVRLYENKIELDIDIELNGVVISTINGNGFEVRKQNDSLLTKLKVNTQMLKILNELGLKEPTIKQQETDEDYL